MKHPLTKSLILIAAAVAIYFATIFYLDSRIPRATATIQLHPESLKIRPTPVRHTGPTTIHFIG